MKFFRAGYFEWGKVEPPAWLQKWWELFLSSEERREDDRVYESLIQKKGQLSGEEFEKIGRWKEGCLLKGEGKEHGRWKPRTTAAYEVWMEAKRNPRTPRATRIRRRLCQEIPRRMVGKDICDAD